LTLVEKFNVSLGQVEGGSVVNLVKSVGHGLVERPSVFYVEVPVGAIFLNRAAFLNHNIEAVKALA